MTITQEKLNHNLVLASSQGNLTKIISLLEKGADISYNDYDALQNAVLKGHLDVVKYLLEQGSFVNANNEYCIRWAARKGFVDIAKLLFQHGANLEAQDNAPLFNAAHFNHMPMLFFLMDNGVNINKVSNKILSILLESKKLSFQQITEDLINKGMLIKFDDIDLLNKILLIDNFDYCLFFYNQTSLKKLFLDTLEKTKNSSLKKQFKHYVELETLNKTLEQNLLKNINLQKNKKNKI